MGTNRLTLAAGLVGAVAVFGMGCRGDKAGEAGSANVTMHSALSITDVASVTLHVQSPTKLPSGLNVPLVLKSGQFGGLVNNLVPSNDYVFSAQAKQSNAAGTVIFSGTANVTITKGTTANVSLFMNQAVAGGVSNSAPVIDSFGWNPNSVAQGGTADLNATAHDPDAGQTATLGFVWTVDAACGIITADAPSGGAASNTDHAVFHAALVNQDCQINLAVTDALGATNKAAFTVRVGLGSTGTGSAKVSAVVNGAPIVASLTADPAQITIPSTGNTPGLTVVASDPEGDTISYAWTSTTPGCHGATAADPVVFGAPTSATTSFTVGNVDSGVTGCTFTVTINDGVWPGTTTVKNTVISSLTLPVTSPTINQPPVFTYAYQSDDTVDNGQTVVLAAVASDPMLGTLTYAFSYNLGAGFTPATTFTTPAPASYGLDPIFTTTGVWITPTGSSQATDVIFRITATSSAGTHLSAYQDIILHGTHPGAVTDCTGQTNGTLCLSTKKCSDSTHLAAGTAQCQSDLCVPGTAAACPASTVTCMDSLCTEAAGGCTTQPSAAGATCSNGNGCSTGDQCNGSAGGVDACVGTAVTCASEKTDLVCQTGTGTCSSTAETNHTCTFTNAPDTTSCTKDTDGCTADHCSAGACVVGGNPCPAGAVPADATATKCDSTSATVFTCSVPAAPACMDGTLQKEFIPPLNAMATASDGSLWVAAEIHTPFNFSTYTAGCDTVADPTHCMNSSGSADIVIAKLDATTGAASVAKVFGNNAGLVDPASPSSTDQRAAGIAVAQLGHLALIGSFEAEIDFSPFGADDGSGAAPIIPANPTGIIGTSGVDFLTTGVAGGVNFFAVLNSDTTPIVAKAVDTGSGAVMAVASNPNVDAFAVCGKADKKVTNLAVTGTYPAGDGMDLFVAKINSNGTVAWGKEFYAAGDQACQSVAVDNNGDVIVAGSYNTGATAWSLQTTPTTVSLPIVNDSTAAVLFVAKFASATGNVLSASAWGTGGKVFPYGLAVTQNSTNAGDILVAGAYTATIPFAGNSITSLGATDAFVARLTTDLTPSWAKSYGDAGSNQSAVGVGASSSGDVYVAGYFTGGLGSVLNLQSYSPGAPNVFVAHLSADGNTVSCKNKYGDTTGAGAQSASNMAMSSTAIYVGGSFSKSINFGSSLSTLTTLNANTYQSFIGKLGL